jgi:hypothetical protein
MARKKADGRWQMAEGDRRKKGEIFKILGVKACKHWLQ